MAFTVGVNSYIALAAADAYFADTMRDESWSEYDDTQKQASLMDATRFLERQVWNGAKTQASPIQLLDWPRTGVCNQEGEALDPNTIPLDIAAAQAEMALQLLIDPDLINNEDNTGTNTKSVQAGDVAVEFFQQKDGSSIPTWILQLITPYLSNYGASSRVYAFGTGEESIFETRSERYGLDEGLA